MTALATLGRTPDDEPYMLRLDERCPRYEVTRDLVRELRPAVPGMAVRDWYDTTETDEVVYLVRMGDTEYVKIGVTRNLERRLTLIQVDCPHPVWLVAAIYNHDNREREIHRAFQANHVRGEWYRLDGDLLAAAEVYRYHSGSVPLKVWRRWMRRDEPGLIGDRPFFLDLDEVNDAIEAQGE